MENKETTGRNKPSSDGSLMEKFTNSGSPAEMEKTADKIIEADPDAYREKLDDKAGQFHKEKKEDAKEQAENDAQFEQPKSESKDS